MEKTYTEKEIRDAMEKVLELAKAHTESKKEFERNYAAGMNGAMDILSIWLFTK